MLEVYFDSSCEVWICERVSDTSDGDGESPFLRVSEHFTLASVNMI